MELWQEQQVWKRVLGDPGREETLAQEAAEILALYRYLGRAGIAPRVMARLQREQWQTISRLRGIRALGGKRMPAWKSVPPRGAPRKLLRRCCERVYTFGRECAARAGTPETGSVYEALARRATEHYLILVGLLGR